MIFHVISLVWNIALAINFLDFLASGMMGFSYFKEEAPAGECYEFLFVLTFSFIIF